MRGFVGNVARDLLALAVAALVIDLALLFVHYLTGG